MASAGPNNPLSESVQRAATVVRGLLRVGVREIVVCAGARNATLVAVVAKCRALRLWSHPEERSAAFFALGRAVASDRPVAVVTTSGTAAAELLPATIEAHYQGRPLVLVTADRPASFRGTGAPQAIEQVGLFGPYVAACCDVSAAADAEALAWTLDEWSRRQPIHLNVCLDEPTAEEIASVPELLGSLPTPRPRASVDAAPLAAFLRQDGPLAVIVGALPRAQQASVAGFLRKLGAPCWCEATSGLREHAGLAHVSDAFFTAAAPQRVLRIGGVPSLRFWRDLETRREIDVFHVNEPALTGLARGGGVCGFPDWESLDVPALEPHASQAVTAPTSPESEWIAALSRAIPENALVFLGNSLPIREWNAFATREARGLRCFANRGANGIDGCVSTFLGVAADEMESWAIIGDLTAVYDLAGPWIARSLPKGRRRLVVINNGGGKIFRQVAALHGLDEGQWRLMENAHGLNFRAWAELWGWSYRHVTDPAELAAADTSWHEVIEITP